MTPPTNLWIAYLLERLQRVRQDLGCEPIADTSGELRIADGLDSMGLVEYVAVVAADLQVAVREIDEACKGHFGTVAELAQAFTVSGFRLPGPYAPRITGAEHAVSIRESTRVATREPAACWITATAARLPTMRQATSEVDQILERPRGWLERHAGIRERCLWQDEDPLAVAAAVGRDCIVSAGVAPQDVGALLVTSEAPPLLFGLAATLHHSIGLREDCPAIEIGGACTGFLACLSVARSMVADRRTVLIIALEAPSRYLRVQPGTAGENAALFGDAIAACLVSSVADSPRAISIDDIILGADGAAASLLRVERAPEGSFLINMDGPALATCAIQTMAQLVEDLAARNGIAIAQLVAILAHGGNGRLPALLARRLALPPERVWSTTPSTGNLGSASLPVAWSNLSHPVVGPMIWVAVGAGITWGGALTGLNELKPVRYQLP